jgi:hypothetical protein
VRITTNLLLSSTVVLLGWFSASPTRVQAQAGYNVVTSGTGTIPSWALASSSFIDASAVTSLTPHNDLCGKIFTILVSASYPPSGTVIDARGVTGSALTCFSGTTPWVGGGAPASAPSIILLPSGQITTNSTWVLPPYTRLIGVGAPGLMLSGAGSGTLISAGASLSGPIIEFIGSVSSTPFSVSVESLTLNGANTTGVSGIVNDFAQEHSYVRNVTFRNFVAPALVVGAGPGDPNPQNSGPYEDLYFLGATEGCVTLNAKNTRGIRDMTCVSNSRSMPLPAAGVLLDGPANVIQDTHFEGFQDGIRIGSQSSSEAFGDVIINADGNSNATQLQMTNTVRISNALGNNVVDLTLTGIRADEYESTAPNSIRDDETSTTLADSTVALYVLGEPIGGVSGAYSKFTTSPAAVGDNRATWGVGDGVPTGSCNVGSLFSNVGGSTSSNTLYLCVHSGGAFGVGTWVAH